MGILRDIARGKAKKVDIGRPFWIKVLAILDWLAGLTAVVFLLIVLISGKPADWSGGVSTEAYVIWILILGGVSFVTGIGLWQGKTWAWALETALSMTSIVSAFLETLGRRPGTHPIVAVAILVYLFTDDVIEYFSLEDRNRFVLGILVIAFGAAFGGISYWLLKV